MGTLANHLGYPLTAADKARGYRTIALAAELFGDYLLTAGVGTLAKGANWLARTFKYADNVHEVAFAADKLGDASRALRQIDTFTPDGLATLAKESPTGALSKLDDAGRLVAQHPNGSPIGGQATSRFVDDLADSRLKIINNDGCFPAGTLINTSAGLKPVEAIIAGDVVHGLNLLTGLWESCAVTNTRSLNYSGKLVRLTIDGETLRATAHHPFWVVRGEDLDRRPPPEHCPALPEGAAIIGRWVDAAYLLPGDVLLTRSGAAAVKSQECVLRAIALEDALCQVYNFTVDDLHSYTVGHGEVLVHNVISCDGFVSLEAINAELRLKSFGRTPNATAFERIVAGGVPNKRPFDEFPWSNGKWGNRIPDHYIETTGTIYEATTLDWNSIDFSNPHSDSYLRYLSKLRQAEQDGWLLNNLLEIKNIEWYGLTILPETGRASELTRILRKHGISYYVLEL
ncbi:MAG: polymorphic toxin-type HINT domain-containing protein [Pirellulales bacterium]|nr:polymorphic toxin-type HINT domain-containing protein [Pirellulales bacterium]